LKYLRFAWLLLLPAIPWTQANIDRRLGPFRAQHDVLYLWSAKHVRRLFPGFEALAADLYWLRTVQYFGSQRVFDTEKRFELLYPLIDITTTLDPRLEMAYRYGATFLSEPWPTGAGRPREGVAILERGVRELPKSWRLRQDLGFFHFLFLNDAQRASEVMMEASRIEGAPAWLLEALAGDILLKGGDRAAARRMWQQIHQQAEEGILRENAAFRLQILDALDRADALQALVKEYEQRLGRKPATLDELRQAGLLPVSPVDPTGVPFDYDARTGTVTVSRTSMLWRPDSTGRH
jgi:hypothetical protein